MSCCVLWFEGGAEGTISPLFMWVIQPCDGGAGSFEGPGCDTGAAEHGASVCSGASQLAAEQLGYVFAPAI